MMSKNIAGVLDLPALQTLAGNEERRRMEHFHALDRDQKAAAIRRLALIGHSDAGIAAATGLSVEMVCRILAEHQ